MVKDLTAKIEFKSTYWKRADVQARARSNIKIFYGFRAIFSVIQFFH